MQVVVYCFYNNSYAKPRRLSSEKNNYRDTVTDAVVHCGGVRIGNERERKNPGINEHRTNLAAATC